MKARFHFPERNWIVSFCESGIGYPDLSDEIKILDEQQFKHPIEALKAVVKAKEVLDAAETIKSVYLSQAVKRYITDLTRRTRQTGDIYLGASPRGTLSLSRALAGLCRAPRPRLCFAG